MISDDLGPTSLTETPCIALTFTPLFLFTSPTILLQANYSEVLKSKAATYFL